MNYPWLIKVIFRTLKMITWWQWLPSVGLQRYSPSITLFQTLILIKITHCHHPNHIHRNRIYSKTDLNSHQATEQVAIHNKYYRFGDHLTSLKIFAWIISVNTTLVQGSWGSGRDRVSDAGDIIIDVINIIVFFIFIIMVINFTPLSLLFRASSTSSFPSTSKLNSIITKIKECSSQHTIRDNASLSTIWKQHQNHGSVHSQPLETCRSPSSASMTSGFDERSIDSIFDTPIK